MKKLVLLAASTLAFAASSVSASTIVNLNAKVNDSASAIALDLAAGTYEVRFVEDEYTAFSRWRANSGCDSNGQLCVQGWENSARIVTSDALYTFGHDGGGYGPKPEELLYFGSANQSFDDAGRFSLRFTLNSEDTVSFYIADNILSDNRGGVSLLVSAVPEPSTWAMLIAGFGLVGFATRRRAALSRSLA